MKDSQDIAIVLLTVTAVILSILLFSNYSTGTKVAYAGNTPVKQGDYIMSTNQISNSTDALIITDIEARRMNVYQTNINNRSIELIDRVNLERAFGQ